MTNAFTTNSMERQRAIERMADDAAHLYQDVRDACPYPFNSWEGRIFCARFGIARQARNPKGTP